MQAHDILPITAFTIITYGTVAAFAIGSKIVARLLQKRRTTK